MLVSNAELKAGQAYMKDLLERHIEQDEERFANITQKIGGNSDNISRIIGMGILLVALSGLMIYLIEQASK